MSRGAFAAKLADSLKQLNLSLSTEEIELMAQLDQIVVKWNRTINLMGFKSEAERFEKYFIESLHATQILPATGQVIDIGSGGGTPALPLAITHSGIEWILLEPNKKKGIFLEEAIALLGLRNIEVRREKYESYEPHQPIDIVTTRGLKVDEKLLEATSRWVKCGGCMYLWTSNKIADKVTACGDDSRWKTIGRKELTTREDACLLILERS